jgi:hypothetical protein
VATCVLAALPGSAGCPLLGAATATHNISKLFFNIWQVTLFGIICLFLYFESYTEIHGKGLISRYCLGRPSVSYSGEPVFELSTSKHKSRLLGSRLNTCCTAACFMTVWSVFHMRTHSLVAPRYWVKVEERERCQVLSSVVIVSSSVMWRVGEGWDAQRRFTEPLAQRVSYVTGEFVFCSTACHVTTTYLTRAGDIVLHNVSFTHTHTHTQSRS